MFVTHLMLNTSIELGHARDLPKSGRKSIPEAKKFDMLLAFQENPYTSSRQVALNNNVY